MHKPIYLNIMALLRRYVPRGALALLCISVLVIPFQNCSNKGQLDLSGIGKQAVPSVPAPAYIDPESPDGATQLGYDNIVQDSERGSVFQVTGASTIISDMRIKVDMQTHYRLSGRFKSIGTTPSKIYFGVTTFRSDGAHIESWEGTRTGFPAMIDSVTPTTINTRTDLIGWYTGSVSSYYKAIGFYFNGDTNRLPDYVLTNWGTGAIANEAGVYSTATGRAVILNIPVPASVQAQITPNTRIYNHYAGGTYVYTAAGNDTVSTTWQEFSGSISGFDMQNSINRFRVGTDNIGFLILANYSQDNTAILLVDDLRFEVVP